jgi:zinc and cadmium transporter
MSPTLASIVAAFAVMGISLSGVVFASKTLGAWMHSRLTYLATFSAGVLAILSYQLIQESLHESSSIALAAASILAGVFVMEIIHHLLPSQHHHHEIPADHAHTAVDGRKVLISDAVHNITDGFIIVPAFFVDWTIGVAATVGILLHELVQEISEFFVLKEAGYSTRRALTLNLAASSTILIGILLALVLTTFTTTLALLAGIAAGGFLSVVVRDLIPHAFESIRATQRWLPHLIAAVVGATLMFGVSTFAPHQEYETQPEMPRTVDAV